MATVEQKRVEADEAGLRLDRWFKLHYPGLGFGKTVEHNLALLANIPRFAALGCPVLIGASRKRFIGTLTGRDAEDRDAGTAATSVALRLLGAAVFRVHNVAFNRDGLAVADAMVQSSRKREPGNG